MGLLVNTWNGHKYLKWSKTETLYYFFRGIAREIRVSPSFFEERLRKSKRHSMLNFFDKKNRCFNFNGIKLPDITEDNNYLDFLPSVFEDVFLIHCFYNDNYSADNIVFLDKRMIEGPYGYVDKNVDVRIKEEDIVIDAGAWIGDFSAYAASKGAISYAFEPTKDTFEWLCKTSELNEGRIIPINLGLGDTMEELVVSTVDTNSGANYLEDITDKEANETVRVTTLDEFVKSNNITKIDFIKSDIEGFERKLLKGAIQTLKEFAPKLAICTYHLPDDPVVLEAIIKEANPKYKIVHLRHKLFASI